MDIKKYLYDLFNKQLGEEKDFFKSPKIIDSVKSESTTKINSVISSTKVILKNEIKFTSPKGLTILNEDEIIDYVKRDKNLREFKKLSDEDLSDSLISDILIECETDNYFEEKYTIKEDLNLNYIFKSSLEDSDFDEKIKKTNIKKFKPLLNKVKGILPWVVMTYYLSIKIKEYLIQNEHPSPSRSKFLQRQIRTTAGLLENDLNSSENNTSESSSSIRNKISNILQYLKLLDSILIASVLTSTYYLSNRKKLQDLSTETFEEIIKQETCETSLEKPIPNSELTVDTTPVEDVSISEFSCPIEIEEPYGPKEPFEEKNRLDRIEMCEIETGDPVSEIEETDYNDTANNAIIENLDETEFDIFVEKNERINYKTELGIIGDNLVYSPVEGNVVNIQKNRIILGDIEDPQETFIESLTNKIKDLYKEYNDIKIFLKDFFIISWFPVLLKQSPLISGTISPFDFSKLVFRSGGITARFNLMKDGYDDAYVLYEKNVEDITGEDNVKEKAENEELDILQNDLLEEENKFYNRISLIAETGENQADVTLPDEDEFILIEYYFSLYQKILSHWGDDNTTNTYMNWLNETLIKRYFVDDWDKEEIEERINSLCRELSRGLFIVDDNFIQDMKNIYNATNSVKSVRGYVINLSKNNSDFTKQEKEDITDTIVFIFKFYVELQEKIEDEEGVEENKFEATESEGSFLKGFFDSLWKRKNEIPDEIDEILKEIDSIMEVPPVYSIIEYNGEEHRYYTVGDAKQCPPPDPVDEENDYTSPHSRYSPGDIEYWRRYCAYATLVGIGNVPNWPVGIPPPTGPINLPVIYIPLKVFQNNWGFTVIGLSICGIYPFPWVLFSNLSDLHTVPIGDPASFIKKEIQTLKKTISQNRKNFKEVTIRNYLDNKRNEIEFTNSQISDVEFSIKEHRREKPRMDRTVPNPRITYSVRIAEWNKKLLVLQEQLLSLRKDRYVLETKYSIVNRALNDEKIEETDDPDIISIKESEVNIDSQLDNLSDLVDSIDPFIAALPISASPNTSNFGPTLKDLQPIIEFGDDLDDNTEMPNVESVVNSFKIDNEDFTRANFRNIAINSFVAWNTYKNALRAANTIKRDAFPKYENLRLSNIRWVSFLFNNWTTEGGRLYGIPGF